MKFNGPGWSVGTVTSLLGVNWDKYCENPCTSRVTLEHFSAKLESICNVEPLLPPLILKGRPFKVYWTADCCRTVPDALMTLPTLTLVYDWDATVDRNSRDGSSVFWLRWIPKLAGDWLTYFPHTSVRYSTSELVSRSPNVIKLYCDNHCAPAVSAQLDEVL